MTHEEYSALTGLNYSSMRDLAVSPLRFWYLHVNPDRPKEEPTAEMDFGSALHCAVLEPDSFNNRYAREISPADYEGVLVTMEDLKSWLVERGVPPKGTRKSQVAAQVNSAWGGEGEPPMIWDELVAAHQQKTIGKVTFKSDDWTRLQNAAHALIEEPELQAIIYQTGKVEALYSAKDPDTGVILKGRLDFATKRHTVDLKTFSQKRGKSIDRTVGDAIYYEGYAKQAWFYNHLRELNGEVGTRPVLAFVESDPPHEVRLKTLGAQSNGLVNLYWQMARIEIRRLIRLYADCVNRFGDRPWRTSRDMEQLEDLDMPQSAF